MLLQQTILPLGSISQPTDLSPVRLPPGCSKFRIICNVAASDRLTSKTLRLDGLISGDNGVTYQKSNGFSWQGPDQDFGKGIGVVGFDCDCVGFAGALVKGTITPDPLGITTDVQIEVD